MSLKIRHIGLHILNMHTRLPFRYGIVTLTALPHLFVNLELEDGGQLSTGLSADHLPPKWFTKNPYTHFRDDLVEMIDIIHAACDTAIALTPAETAFDLWLTLYTEQKRWAADKSYPPLLWNFGVTLVERALIDAFCRAKGITFSEALRQNHLGIDLDRLYKLHGGPLAANLPHLDPAALLPKEPLRQIIARHTVGMTDPLETADIPPHERLDDGLPQSLDECIQTYGLRHFKIKLSGNVDADAARLRRLAAIIGRLAPTDYAFTLDANKNFKELPPFRTLWESLSADPTLSDFLKRLIFIEQPFHRDVALSPEIKQSLQAWPSRPPLIIDESDAEIPSLLQALDAGYLGTSHKNCKGVFKSIANCCLLRKRGSGSLFSGEDLSNIGPIALPQDLAVAANLGISSIERNSQHYFAGLSMLPPDIQQSCLNHHPDLYRRAPAGFPTLNIQDGLINIDSLIDSPLGVNIPFDPSRFTPLNDWRFDSLGLS